jgi:hypothetical protein
MVRVILRPVRVTTVAMEKQYVLNTVCVCVLFLLLSLLPCSVGSSVHCLKAILSRASFFISAKVFPFLLATSITQSSQVLLGLPLPLLFSLLASVACFGFL